MTDIESLFSPNPNLRRDFSVTNNSHRVYTVVTFTPSVVRDWIHQMRRHHIHHLRQDRLIVGLGVQWTPNSNFPSTLQLCVGRRCLIFQLRHADRVPRCLRTFLSDPNVNFVGVANYRDKAMLQRSKHNMWVSRLVDLRNVASERIGCRKQISMERLAELVLGMEDVEKDTRVGRSDWDEYWLSDEQIGYACVDAFVSFMLGKSLRVWSWVDSDEMDTTDSDKNVTDSDEMVTDNSDEMVTDDDDSTYTY